MSKVIVLEFLDATNPQVGKKQFNDLILKPTDNLEALLAEIEAEEFEGRSLVVSLTTKNMSDAELEVLPEWEP